MYLWYTVCNMNIRKIGHCCLRIEVDGVVILTDPGNYSDGQNSLTGIDAVLITHEHADHFHLESLNEVLRNNPEAQVVTNASVGKLLAEEGRAYTLCEGRDTMRIGDVAIEAHDGKHEEIFEEIGQVQNTGYCIADKLFYPGDSFHVPDRAVDILALPVSGPWCRIADAVRYALAVKPKRAFPVHDALLKDQATGIVYRIPEQVLPAHEIEFVAMRAGEEREF
jgi:L-ascorbate metabolism protein UlaG (beta-lactamase superfamily)